MLLATILFGLWMLKNRLFPFLPQLTFNSSGTKQARKVLYTVLCSACEDGDLTIPEAVDAIKGIFKENSWQFYNLKEKLAPLDFGSVSSSVVLNEHTRSSDGITFVRVLWVDASGQHRCRVSSPWS